MSTQTAKERSAELAHVRADRVRAQALRATSLYLNPHYRHGLEAKDAILAKRERELEGECERPSEVDA